jgi:hypothetical protein
MRQPDQTGYGPAWTDAAWLHERDRPITVIMLTAHAIRSLEVPVNTVDGVVQPCPLGPVRFNVARPDPRRCHTQP